jgi:hypothetical protein
MRFRVYNTIGLNAHRGFCGLDCKEHKPKRKAAPKKSKASPKQKAAPKKSKAAPKNHGGQNTKSAIQTAKRSEHAITCLHTYIKAPDANNAPDKHRACGGRYCFLLCPRAVRIFL